MSRQTKPSDFVGKTVRHIDCLAVNCLSFEFTDGSEVMLEVECIQASLQLFGIAVVETGAKRTNPTLALLQALEDAEYIKEIATPTTIPQKFGPPMKADIVETVGLEDDPNWIALKKALT